MSSNVAAKEAMQSGEYLVAYELYSEQLAQQFKDGTGANERATTLINRAIATRRLDQPAIALYDAQRASLICTENATRAKAIYHAAFCCFEGSSLEDAQNFANLCIRIATENKWNSIVANMKKLKDSIRNERNNPENQVYGPGMISFSLKSLQWDKLSSYKNLESEEVIARINEQAGIISNGAVEVKVTPNRGRGLFACKNIRHNAFTEKPVIGCIFKLNKKLYCHQCASNIVPESALKCSNCELLFCDSVCYRKAMESYHPILCNNEIPPENSCLASLEDSTAVSSLWILAAIKVFAEAKMKGITPVEVDSMKDLCVANCEEKLYFPKTPVFTNYSQLLKHLDISEEDPQFQFWHFMAVQWRLLSNTFGQGDITKGAKFLLGGLITYANHRCLVNNANFVNNTIVAKKRIKPKQEIVISYLPDTEYGPSRNAHLGLYGIQCSCSLCNKTDG